MIVCDMGHGVYSMETEAMRLGISTGSGLMLTSIFHKKSGREWLTESSEFFCIEVLKRLYPGSSFEVTDVQEMKDAADEGLSFTMAAPAWGITARVIILSDPYADCAVFLQLGAKWPDNQPQNVYYTMPFMKNFRCGDSKWRLSGNPSPRQDGSSAMALHINYPMPACNLSADDRDGFAMRPYELDIGFGGLNMTGRWFDAPAEGPFIDHRLFVPIDDYPLTNIIAFKLTAVNEGWCEAYDRWRRDMRALVDLSGYQREDLRWMHEAMFPGFVFSYSRQFFDYETQQFDIDRVIDYGEKFGGYDFLILWHQYPRLGADHQGQWDFNHNVPGGMHGLRKIVDRAHARGVKIVFPYNPWDDEGIPEEQYVENMVEMVRATDCDGIFFDTMDTVPLTLRQKLDALRPGVAFFSEAPPRNEKMAALIMANWDQSPDFLDMPQSFVLRYLFPEMNSMTVGRWRVGEGKDMLIDRAVFNGTGFFLWEEVFGRWLPFSEKHVAKLNKWRGILESNRDIFVAGSPIPFYTVLQEGLYANRFASKNGDKVVFTVYNGSDRVIEGKLLDSRIAQGRADERWSGVSVACTDGLLSARIEPGQVLLVFMERGERI